MATSPAGTSWGRWPRCTQAIARLSNRFAPIVREGSLLPYGNGRSYGDVCLNEGGTLLATRGLDRFIRFDPDDGVLECEAGVLLAEIIDLVLGYGWFLPVTPGTGLVTASSFGNHVLEFDLLRSDGRTLQCSMQRHADWFRATIGGLGLTGLILTAKLQMRRVPGPWIAGDSLRFGRLREFFSIARESDAQYEYTVGWVDSMATGRSLGGRFHARQSRPRLKAPPLGAPSAGSVHLASVADQRIFRQPVYYHRPSAQSSTTVWHFQPFFYPLDGVLEWNRIYGPRGFFQYQCVIPEECANDAIEEIARHRTGSFLAVLKLFGRIGSLGMMSFPRPASRWRWTLRIAARARWPYSSPWMNYLRRQRRGLPGQGVATGQKQGVAEPRKLARRGLGDGRGGAHDQDSPQYLLNAAADMRASFPA